MRRDKIDQEERKQRKVKEQRLAALVCQTINTKELAATGITVQQVVHRVLWGQATPKKTTTTPPPPQAVIRRPVPKATVEKVAAQAQAAIFGDRKIKHPRKLASSPQAADEATSVREQALDQAISRMEKAIQPPPPSFGVVTPLSVKSALQSTHQRVAGKSLRAPKKKGAQEEEEEYDDVAEQLAYMKAQLEASRRKRYSQPVTQAHHNRAAALANEAMGLLKLLYDTPRALQELGTSCDNIHEEIDQLKDVIDRAKDKLRLQRGITTRKADFVDQAREAIKTPAERYAELEARTLHYQPAAVAKVLAQIKRMGERVAKPPDKGCKTRPPR